MDLENPLARLANPLLRIVVLDDVADVEIVVDVEIVAGVEIIADRRALKRVNKPDEFGSAEQELVPDFFDGDLDAVLLSIGDELADAGVGALVGVSIWRRSLVTNVGTSRVVVPP